MFSSTDAVYPGYVHTLTAHIYLDSMMNNLSEAYHQAAALYYLLSTLLSTYLSILLKRFKVTPHLTKKYLVHNQDVTKYQY